MRELCSLIHKSIIEKPAVLAEPYTMVDSRERTTVVPVKTGIYRLVCQVWMRFFVLIVIPKIPKELFEIHVFILPQCWIPDKSFRFSGMTFHRVPSAGIAVGKQAGLTYVELMVAALVSAILCAVIIQAYLIQKHIFQTIQGMATIQENARIAYYMLGHDVRNSGYMDCAQQVLTSSSLIKFNPERSLQIDDLPKRIRALRVPGTDVVAAQEIESPVVRVKRAAASHITLFGKNPYKKNEVLFIYNCLHGEVIRVKEINGNGRITTAAKLQADYKDDAEIARLQRVYYCIGNTGRLTEDKHAVWALYRLDLTGPDTTPIEILEGVENMRVTFASANTGFKKAAEISDWSSINKVRIVLLLNSLVNVFDMPQTYIFNGVRYAASDRWLHKEWIMVFKVYSKANE